METSKKGELVGVVGGLGPKASSVFYDSLIVDNRILLHRALLTCKEQNLSAAETLEFLVKNDLSTANWTKEEVALLQSTLATGVAQLRDQDHIQLLIFNNPKIPGRPEFILGLSSDDPTDSLTETCERLLNAGATKLCIICNTAHYFVPVISERLEAMNLNYRNVFMNMLDMTFEYVARKLRQSKMMKVGVLGTKGALQTKVFEISAEKICKDLSLVNTMTSTHGNQQNVTDAVFSKTGIKAGYTDIAICKHSQQNLIMVLHEIIKLIEYEGVNAVVLGCTELPLVVTRSNIVILQKQNLISQTDFDIVMNEVIIIDPAKILADEILHLTLLSNLA